MRVEFSDILVIFGAAAHVETGQLKLASHQVETNLSVYICCSQTFIRKQSDNNGKSIIYIGKSLVN